MRIRFLRLSVAVALAVVFASSTTAGQAPAPPGIEQQAAEALQERRFADALAAFLAGTQAQPRRAPLWFGAGVAAYMLGQNREAEGHLVRALELQPTLTDASLLLGELQYRSGRTRDAIATYEAALTHAAGDARFVTRLAEWRAEERVQGRFIESRGAHFRVLFEGPADQALARRAVEILEAAYARIGGALSAYPDQPIEVVLYTQQQFRDITRAPEWAAGTFDGRIRLPIRGAADQIDELERILAHEFTHAVVARLGGPSVPMWLNEGLAMMFEPGALEESARVLAGPAPRPALQELHRSFGGLDSAEAAVAYALSAASVSRMFQLRGGPAVALLLRDVATGVPFAAAFNRRIAMPYDDFQQMMARR